MWQRFMKRWNRRVRARRGQSMVAYALVSAVLLTGVTYAGIRIIPDMLKAIDQYAATIYFGINLPFP